MTQEQNAAVKVAKEKLQQTSDEFEVMDVKVRLVSVPIGLIQDAQAHIEPPKVPTFYNDTKGREEENPNDPNYLMQLEKYTENRSLAALDTMIMFGIEIDKLPENDEWLKKIKFLGKRGTLDLSLVDFEDEIDIGFLFKKYVVASTTGIITRIGQKTGVNREAIAQAKAGF